MRWARLRFQILGPLLAAPADEGELKARIEELAARAWRHPTTGETIRFSFKTIERWWYIARAADRSLAALARKVPSHAGTHPSLGQALVEAIARQHRDHPRWSFQLHHDNLVALAREDPRLGPVPGLRDALPVHEGAGPLARAQEVAIASKPTARRSRRARRARTRSRTCHGLWHLDFHQGSRPVLTARRDNGKSPSSSASSTTAPASAATCSGISTRPPRRSCTPCRRPSRSARCRARF